jgi:hypothetical protein
MSRGGWAPSTSKPTPPRSPRPRCASPLAGARARASLLTSCAGRQLDGVALARLAAAGEAAGDAHLAQWVENKYHRRRLLRRLQAELRGEGGAALAPHAEHSSISDATDGEPPAD